MAINKINLLFVFCLLVISCATFSPTETINSESESEAGLHARFFGTSSIYFSDGSNHFFIDAFLSRPSISKNILNGFKPHPDVFLPLLSESNIHELDAIFVAHSHYDHVLDAPRIAIKTNATLYGSEQVKSILAADEEFKALHSFSQIDVGRFVVTPISTPHVPKNFFVELLEKAYMFAGRGCEYITGDQNFSFFIEHPEANVLVVPSANYPPSFGKDISADVVFLGIGLLNNQADMIVDDETNKTYIETLWEKAVVATNARLVIPIHWDNFHNSLDKPLRSPPLQLDDVEDTVKKLRRLAARGNRNGESIALEFAPAKLPFSLRQ
ncbi:MBL fold metallo-hydrolase [Alteromonadaceae bacterium A_SAG4]|nr:MBL fold metallo-hydrolase [Alteromonadaceae bacterium A_SAG4]NKX33426.1 MBL fold metallo-hydrolase [Alteromonadaceae bacterium A_SAG3]